MDPSRNITRPEGVGGHIDDGPANDHIFVHDRCHVDDDDTVSLTPTDSDLTYMMTLYRSVVQVIDYEMPCYQIVPVYNKSEHGNSTLTNYHPLV